MMVKLLDGCGLNGHRWLFAAGSTDVGWTLRLERRGGAAPPKIYRKERGVLAPALADLEAAPCDSLQP